MKKHRFLLGLYCSLVIVSPIITGISVHSALHDQNVRSALVLEKTFSGILERAHHLKDDLTIQAAIMAISQAPGVVVVAVIDEQGRILAHTDPSQIGQNLGHIRDDVSLVRYPLNDRGAHWGMLLLRLSHTAEQQAFHRLIVLLLLISGGALAGVSYLQVFWTSEFQRLLKQFENQEALCHLKEEQIHSLELERERSEKILKSWIRDLVERLPEPELVLDSHQRILAMNSQAQHQLDLTSKPIEISWYEIPALADCGAVLQRSLETPGQPVEAEVRGAFVKIMTASDPPAGTHITWPK